MLFSIILPTYNRAPLIDNAIRSLLSQDYHDFELLIIDDGSTDETSRIVNAYDDERVLYYYKENEERNIARNFGISKAKGRYIGFLDSDDTIYSNHLNEAFSMILNNNYPEIIHLNFDIQEDHLSTSQIRNFESRDINKALIDDNYLNCNSIFIRSDIIKKYQFLDSINAVVGEDYYLWLRLASRYKIHLSKTVTSTINVHQDRSLKNIDANKLKIGIQEIHDSLLKDQVFLQYYRRKAYKYFSNNYLFIALHLAIEKQKLESIRYIKRSLTTYLPNIFSVKLFGVLKTLFR